MSGFDVNVWFSDTTVSAAQAAEIRRHVGSDWVIFANDPHVEAFLAELRRRYPDFVAGDEARVAQWGPQDPFLQSVDDPRPPPPTPAQLRKYRDAGPAVWNGGISQNGLFLSMSMVWKHAMEVFPFIQSMAQAHRLTVMDEDGGLQQPPATPSGTPALLQLSLTLHIAGRSPAFDASVTEGQTKLVHRIVPTRLDAHRLARTLAEEHHEIGYRLDDPRCLAQAYEVTPVKIDTPRARAGVTVQMFQFKRRDPN